MDKKYVLVSCFELVTTVVTSDCKHTIVKFKNGSRVAGTRGFFTTDNEQLQKAIEQSAAFGRVYRFESQTDDQPRVQLSYTEPLRDTTVTSRNKAIAFLKEKFNAEFTSTVEIAAMKTEAEERYNVIFANWD